MISQLSSQEVSFYSEEECDKSKFEAWLAATIPQKVVDRNALDKLCADELLATLLYTRICQSSKPMDAYFAFTIDSRNRVTGATEVLEKVGLQEQGRGDVIVLLDDGRGTVVSAGCRRIVYGDHGPFIELERDKTQWVNFHIHNERPFHSYYNESFTRDKKFMPYEQLRSAQNVPNPPRTGKRRVRNNRPEGYADYLPGACYLPALSVTWKDKSENAFTAQTVNFTLPSSYLNVGMPSPSGNGMNSSVLTMGRKQRVRCKAKLLAEGLSNCSTWTTQPARVVRVTKAKPSPGISPAEWELPVTKTYIVSQGHRPVVLDQQTLTTSYGGDQQEIAGYVDYAASK